MDDYGEFKEELNRMPTDRRSSQKTYPQPSVPLPVCSQAAGCRRKPVNNQKAGPVTQRRDMCSGTISWEPFGVGRSNLLASQAEFDPRRSEYRQDSVNKRRNGRTQCIPQRRIEEEPPEIYDSSGCPLNMADLPDSQEFNASGRPFNISEFATGPVAPRRQASVSQNISGRPLNLSEFAGARVQDSSNQVLDMSHFVSDPPVTQGQSCSSNLDGIERQSLSQHPEEYNDCRRCLNLSTSEPNGTQNISKQDPKSLSHNTQISDCSDNYSESTNSAEVQQESGSLKPSYHAPLGFLVFEKESLLCATSLSKPTPATKAQPPSHKNVSKETDPCESEIPSFPITSLDSGFESRLQGSKTSPQAASCHKEQSDKLGASLCHGDIEKDASTISNKRTQTKSPPDLPKRHPLFNSLVKDTYFPGAIDDAVNGRLDFNAIAFDLTFGCRQVPQELKPEEVPISLLEAFDQRLKYENDFRECLKRRRRFCLSEVESGTRSDAPQVPPKFWIHREELKVASTVDIDLATSFRDQPESGLTEALACLARAEKMNSFDESVHKAEEAISRQNGEQSEKAALKSSCSFHINMQKDETTAQSTYRPIEIISYVGTTMPREN